MSHMIELSDDIILDARAAGESTNRSLTEQLERWARLGRAVEPLLRGNSQTGEPATSMSECLDSVGTDEGRQRLADYLSRRPYPHYEPVDGATGVFVRVESDGTRTTGRFENRQFVIVD